MQPLLVYYSSATESIKALRDGKVKAVILKDVQALYASYRAPCMETMVGEVKDWINQPSLSGYIAYEYIHIIYIYIIPL